MKLGVGFGACTDPGHALGSAQGEGIPGGLFGVILQARVKSQGGCFTISTVLANLDFSLPDVGQMLVRPRIALCNGLICFVIFAGRGLESYSLRHLLLDCRILLDIPHLDFLKFRTVSDLRRTGLPF